MIETEEMEKMVRAEMAHRMYMYRHEIKDEVKTHAAFYSDASPAEKVVMDTIIEIVFAQAYEAISESVGVCEECKKENEIIEA